MERSCYFSLLAIICAGAAIFVNGLLYNEEVVNEYEIVSMNSYSFSYKTDDGGIADKTLNAANFTVYKSKNDRAYAVETITTVRSKINNGVHWFITFSSELGKQNITYKIYLPESEYQKYISR